MGPFSLLVFFISGMALLFSYWSEYFLILNQFSNLTDFTNSRVINLDLWLSSGELVIKDGERFGIWDNLLRQFIKNPLFGSGIGTRAFGGLGVAVESHNLLLFLYPTFGVFIATAILSFWILSLKRIYKIFIKDVFWVLMIANFIFQSLVGNFFGQAPLVLFFLIIHMVYPIRKCKR